MEERVREESRRWRVWKKIVIRAAVLGSPISHSLSPVLHRAAYQALGLKGRYEAIEVKAGSLEGFIATRDETWTGFSLTMPLKEEVLRIATSVDPLALQIHSANTLLRSGSGWRALTTDVTGFQHALISHRIAKFERVLIIGAGATARAAAAACDESGRQIAVIRRSNRGDDTMRSAVGKSAISFLEWNGDLSSADLVINTTPAGVADIFLPQVTSQPAGVFFEALYNPWPTKLLARWRAFGGETIDGLDLLVHQGIDQVALMGQVAVDRDLLAPLLRSAGLVALAK
jgi:shikimate dehydrogenase